MLHFNPYSWIFCFRMLKSLVFFKTATGILKMKLILFRLQLEGRRTFLLMLRHVEFKENNTAHFHRHVMYHLDKHNQVNSENISQSFIFRECGRLLCDSHSLMIHNIIHLDWAGKTLIWRRLKLKTASVYFVFAFKRNECRWVKKTTSVSGDCKKHFDNTRSYSTWRDQDEPRPHPN